MSAGGSCAPAAAAGAGAAGSVGAGVSDVWQQMGGMQLAQGKGSSGGGDSATLGASVVQQQPQQQQQPVGAQGGLVQRTAEAAADAAGALSAVTGSAAASDGRKSPVDEVREQQGCLYTWVANCHCDAFTSSCSTVAYARGPSACSCMYPVFLTLHSYYRMVL